MDINKILNELDSLFASGQSEKAGAFLKSSYDSAMTENDFGSALTILNELIGFYRVTTQFEKAKQTVQSIMELICKMELSDTVTEGTSLLNIATVYRAMGDMENAEKYYMKAESIYCRHLEDNDYRIAGLYNNMSLMYQEKERFDEAAACLEKAMAVITKIPGADIETAVTHTNLGQIYCKTEQFDKARTELDRAEEIFIKTDINDEHYGGLASAKGYLFCQLGDYKKSADYYEKALLSVYHSYGITANFKSLQSDLRRVYKLCGEKEYSSMLDVCEAFYEKYGKPMIHEKFPEYEDRIAAGLCGEGSECFGTEDEISLDHDCGPCFAMWVTDEVYSEIGEQLQKAYDELPRIFAGYIRAETKTGTGRCGVCRIDDFYSRVLGGRKFPESYDDWKSIEESALAAAVNGRVFYDPQGIFTEKRNALLCYYPHNLWIEKLAKELIYSAQTGQYNYGRSMSRGDYVAASIALSEYMQSTMHIVYLLNRTYSPYYKWQNRMLHRLEILPEAASIMEAICDMPPQREAWKNFEYTGLPNPDDMIAQTIEITAKFIVNALHEMNLSEKNDTYLETQGLEVLKHMNENNEITREQVIDEIIQYEWVEFDMVRNKGGRASCQNDWDTFSIMRKSQYMTWTDEMLNEYLWHIDDALKNGRNLITEKYGRMMKTASPEEYEEIKAFLPEISEERRKITEAIVQIQVEWMEEFSKNYPKMAANARSIRTAEDNMYNTSYETYLRGELDTYSESLLL
ncbi:MAG: DUF4125 family protein, partial [Ruminococcus sp.]